MKMSAAMDEDDYPEIDLENTMIPLTDIDRQILSMKDEDYHRHSWEDLKEIIGRSSHQCIPFDPLLILDVSEQLSGDLETTSF